jgi:hypothetical protein
LSRQFAKELKIDGTRIAVLTIGQFGVCFYHGVKLSGIQSRLRPCQAHKAKKTRHLLTVLSKEGAARPSEVRAMLGKRPRAEQAKAGSMSEPKALYQLLEEWRAREDRPKHKQPDGDVTYGICADELETALRAWDAALGQDMEGKPFDYGSGELASRFAALLCGQAARSFSTMRRPYSRSTSKV